MTPSVGRCRGGDRATPWCREVPNVNKVLLESPGAAGPRSRRHSSSSSYYYYYNPVAACSRAHYGGSRAWARTRVVMALFMAKFHSVHGACPLIHTSLDVPRRLCLQLLVSDMKRNDVSAKQNTFCFAGLLIFKPASWIAHQSLLWRLKDLFSLLLLVGSMFPS